MKSAVPKVLHRAAGLPLIDHVLRAADVAAPVVDRRRRRSQADAAEGRSRRHGRASALHCRSRSSAPGTRCCRRSRCWRAAGHGRAAVRRRAAAARRRPCGRSVGRTRRRRRGRDGADRDVDDPHGYGRIVRESGRDHRDRRAQGRVAGRARRFAKSTAASTPSTSRRCSPRCARSASANAQGEYYLPDLVRIYRERGLAGRNRRPRRSAGNPGREQPEGAGAT